MKSKRQLLRFAEFVAKMVAQPDFEEYADAFAEIACRKLCDIGIVKKDEENWMYEWEDGDGDA